MRRAALVALAVFMPSSLEAQSAGYGAWQLTEYWIAAESPALRDRRVVPVRDRAGRVLTQACESFANCLCMEGTGRSWDGRLFNWDARVQGRACFTEVDTSLYPYGAGVQGFALVPYRSLAVDPRYIPWGRVVSIPALQGLRLPGGAPHDGCFVAVDGGGAIRGHHIDLFLPSIEVWRRLSREGALPPRVLIEIDAPRCAYASRFAIHPVPGDPLPDPLLHREPADPPDADAGAPIPSPRRRVE